MSKYSEKRAGYRPKNEEKKSKFGFDYDEQSITYKTEIPALPEKPRHRPDEKIHEKKVKELEEKLQNLKKQRKEKKDTLKNESRQYDEQLNDLKENINLGKLCLKVLDLDYNELNAAIDDLERKIGKKNFNLKTLQQERRPYKEPPQKTSFKPIEEMNFSELVKEERRIEERIASQDLSKKQQIELNAIITKIGRLKANASRQSEPIEESTKNKNENLSKLDEDIELTKASIQKLKGILEKKLEEREQIEHKIQIIKEDISDFIEEFKDLAEKEGEHQQTSALYEQSKKIKDLIYEERQHLAKLTEDFKTKTHQFQYQQEKIAWIKWAQQIQEKISEAWELEKQERKKAKLKGEKITEKKQTDPNNPTTEKHEQRKKINRNQKQIDICAFLISYCKKLYPENQKTVDPQKKEKDLSQELKKGQWAKQKGIQVIHSKKDQKDEEVPTKPNKKKEMKVETEQNGPKGFSHTYFVAQSFDSAKVLPPATVEELDKTIEELEDKLEYYLAHPEQTVDQKKNYKNNENEKYANEKYANEKYTKTKVNKRVINTEDFPSLA